MWIPRIVIDNFFSWVWYRQSATDTSLAFVSLCQVDEWVAKYLPFSIRDQSMISKTNFIPALASVVYSIPRDYLVIILKAL